MKAAKDEIQRMIGTTAGVGNEYKEQSGGMNTPWSGMQAMFNGAADLDQMQQFMQMQMQMNNPTFYQMPPPVESGEAKEGMGYPMSLTLSFSNQLLLPNLRSLKRRPLVWMTMKLLLVYNGLFVGKKQSTGFLGERRGR